MTTIRKNTTRLLVTVAVSFMAMAGIAGAAQAHGHTPPPGELTGCPEGAVCVYPDDDWNWGNPTYVFYSEGAHQIYNQYGAHRVYNNQEDLGYAELCAGSDGEQCDNLMAPGEYTDINLDDVNSIHLFSY